jgi:hypothetical protein
MTAILQKLDSDIAAAQMRVRDLKVPLQEAHSREDL